MAEKKVSEFTIMDITERMLAFTLRDEVKNAEEVASYNDGTRAALNDMREDMQSMTENEFVSKYEQISLEQSDKSFDMEPDSAEKQYIEGYCNTIDDVLSFLNPAYIYDQMEALTDGIDFADIDLDEIFDEEHEHHHDCGCGCGGHHHH